MIVRKMVHQARTLNRVLRFAVILYVTFLTAALAQDDEASELLRQLQTVPSDEAMRLTGEIMERWSHSGSAALDYLLDRGTEAIEAQDYRAAIEHLTALTDHAPEFAEGWNARGTAFYLMEELGMALADLERAIALNPQHFGALSGIGVILEQIDQPEAALNAYEAAHAIHPHMPDVADAIERLRDATQGTSL